MNAAIIELLVLAGIAIFLVMRLKSVLGTREGFEKPQMQEDKAPKKRDFQVIEGGDDVDIVDNVEKGSTSAEALALMKRTDKNFSVNDFLGGARMAYEMILMAFENGDISEVQPFLAPEIEQAFDYVINDRKFNGLSIEANFIGLREMKIADARFDVETKVAEIAVSFVAELTSVVKDKSGNIVEGDDKQIKRQRDTWTFARSMGSEDPNWQLVATGE
jgi:predicted lipid-binding transport protein (Tim44 family)